MRTLLTSLLKAQKIEYLGINRRRCFSPLGRKLSQSGTLADPQFIRPWPREIIFANACFTWPHIIIRPNRPGKHGDATLWDLSLEVQVLGLAHTLQSLKAHAPEAKLFYASSSHIYGSPAESPQNEARHLKAPINVYGVTKVAGMEVCRHYREQHGLFASVGILYNHESVYRKRGVSFKKKVHSKRPWPSRRES